MEQQLDTEQLEPTDKIVTFSCDCGDKPYLGSKIAPDNVFVSERFCLRCNKAMFVSIQNLPKV